jgi:hypothetical protein
MSYMLEPLLKRLRLYQQNLNKLDKVQYDLINSAAHKDWDLLLLQEPYIDTLGNTRANYNRRVLYPTSHLADTTIKHSVILMNLVLDTNTWSQVSIAGMNNVMTIQLKHPRDRTEKINCVFYT